MFCFWSCSSFCVAARVLHLLSGYESDHKVCANSKTTLAHFTFPWQGCIFSDHFYFVVIFEIKPGAVQVESAKQVFVEKAQNFSCAQMFLLIPAGQRTLWSSAGISYEFFFFFSHLQASGAWLFVPLLDLLEHLVLFPGFMKCDLWTSLIINYFCVCLLLLTFISIIYHCLKRDLYKLL